MCRFSSSLLHWRAFHFFCDRVCYYIFTINSHFILSQQLNLLWWTNRGDWRRERKKKNRLWLNRNRKKQALDFLQDHVDFVCVAIETNIMIIRIVCLEMLSIWRSHNVPIEFVTLHTRWDWLFRFSSLNSQPFYTVYLFNLVAAFNSLPFNIFIALLIIHSSQLFRINFFGDGFSCVTAIRRWKKKLVTQQL